MTLILASLAILAVAGLASATLGRNSNRLASALGVSGAVVGSVMGLIPTIETLVTGSGETLGPLGWNVPWGSFFVEIDRLSALFIAPIFVLTALAAVYGSSYLSGLQGRKSLGTHWFFYNLLTASMVMVALARNGMLFLTAWEVMSLASFFLVTFDDESPSVRAAGRTYLIATHIGTAFLFVFFILLGRKSGSMDFEALLAPVNQPDAATSSIMFVLAVVGFGTKAGFMPTHVWLPEAHPAAPSHVSAVMSGVMVKTGIYGIVRALTLLPAPPLWWGWLLVAVGGVSGVMGVLYALAQHDIKRLLAYSTVENVGIVALGLGTGLIGTASDNDMVALLGFAGALWHVMNHAMFKGLLFLGAGAVAHGAHTRDLNAMGGLLKRMPLAGLAIIAGSTAICGLPPFNGFPGEFLIYLGAYKGELVFGPESAATTLAVIGSLALVGGLAVVAFTKLVGVALLGEPRTSEAAHATAPSLVMSIPMLLLAAICLALGLGAGFVVRPIASLGASLGSVGPQATAGAIADASPPLEKITAAGAIVVGLFAFLAILRFVLLRKREVGRSGTWGCGYAAPTARMQYTGSSYVQPALLFFDALLRPVRRIRGSVGLFPEPGSVETETGDLADRGVYRPAFRSVAWISARFRWIQRGNVHSYVLYISVTLFVLLVWYLGWERPA